MWTHTECSNCKKYKICTDRYVDKLGQIKDFPKETVLDQYNDCYKYEESRNDITIAVDNMWYSRDLDDWSKLTILDYIQKYVKEYGRIEE